MFMEKIPPLDPSVVRVVQRARRLDRAQVEYVVESLIAVLDARDGDVDLEDSEASEWQVNDRGRRLDYHIIGQHRGDDDPDTCDRAWIEWDGREPFARRRALHELLGDGAHEDDEPNGDECDGSWHAEDEFMAHEAAGPGCDLSDPGGCAVGEDDEPGCLELFEYHRVRLRAARSSKDKTWGGRAYRLRDHDRPGRSVAW